MIELTWNEWLSVLSIGIASFSAFVTLLIYRRNRAVTEGNFINKQLDELYSFIINDIPLKNSGRVHHDTFERLKSRKYLAGKKLRPILVKYISLYEEIIKKVDNGNIAGVVEPPVEDEERKAFEERKALAAKRKKERNKRLLTLDDLGNKLHQTAEEEYLELDEKLRKRYEIKD
jgi:hypothetical protein